MPVLLAGVTDQRLTLTKENHGLPPAICCAVYRGTHGSVGIVQYTGFFVEHNMDIRIVLSPAAVTIVEALHDGWAASNARLIIYALLRSQMLAFLGVVSKHAHQLLLLAATARRQLRRC